MVARLHHESVASGDPARWLVMTHGICGSGGNWRTVARKLVARRPEWGVHLVDLRQHGRSDPGEPPQTIAACARDLVALLAELGNVAALSGHSFGGKVVVATRALAPRDLLQTWTLDAAPGPRTPMTANETVLQLLALVDRSPRIWTRREDFVAAIVADGHAPPLAQWFAMNLAPVDGGYAVRLDTAAIRELLADYNRVDLWPAVDDPSGGDIELVVASRSTTYTAEDAAHPLAPHVHRHVIDGGHWLHVDNPDAVIELFCQRLS
ncbi:MAG TPA: alpha/beta hydrolase [Kofleriaceae bacterium]